MHTGRPRPNAVTDSNWWAACWLADKLKVYVSAHHTFYQEIQWTELKWRTGIYYFNIQTAYCSHLDELRTSFSGCLFLINIRSFTLQWWLSGGQVTSLHKTSLWPCTFMLSSNMCNSTFGRRLHLKSEGHSCCKSTTVHRGQDSDSSGAGPTFLLISVMACFPDEKGPEQECVIAITTNCERRTVWSDNESRSVLSLRRG